MTAARDLPPTDEALARHARACERDTAGYMDPVSGLFVLSSSYLKKQGRCCGQGCRHCPWPPDVQARAGRAAGKPAWPWRPA